MVDSWSGRAITEAYAATGDRVAMASESKRANAERMCRARVGFAGDRAVILNGDSTDMAAQVPDGSLDVAFIDADHSYTGAARDIPAWAPKVRAGGWLGGHDWCPGADYATHQYGIAQAVMEFGLPNSPPSRLWSLKFGEDSSWWLRVPGANYPVTAADYLRLLQRGDRVWLSNWGDGELGAVLGRRITNSDGIAYTAEMQRELGRCTLSAKQYFRGINPGRKMWQEVNEWRRRNRDTLWGTQWTRKEAWTEALSRGLLGPFIAWLRTQRVLIVGPACLQGLARDGVLPSALFVDVPHPGAWGERATLADQIRQHMDNRAPQVVLLSAGFASNWIVDELYDSMHDQCSMIDVGAMWMPFVDQPLRKHHQRYIDRGAIAASLEAANQVGA